MKSQLAPTFELANACNNLALLYRQQGKFADSEILFKRAATIYEKTATLDNGQLLVELLAHSRPAVSLRRRRYDSKVHT